MSETEPAAPRPVYAFSEEVELADVIEVGETAVGRRRVIPIVGGTVSGPRLRGRILSGGADFQVIRADGVAVLEARYTIETDDGAVVYVDNRGYRTADPADVERLARGEPVDPSRVYFRTAAFCETAAPRYEWLARRLLVGVGERLTTRVRLNFFDL